MHNNGMELVIQLSDVVGPRLVVAYDGVHVPSVRRETCGIRRTLTLSVPLGETIVWRLSSPGMALGLFMEQLTI